MWILGIFTKVLLGEHMHPWRTGVGQRDERAEVTPERWLKTEVTNLIICGESTAGLVFFFFLSYAEQGCEKLVFAERVGVPLI